jgi:protein O-GlcNAc transferase
MANLPAYPVMRRNGICAHDRIRVGYFSGDFRNHPVARLAVGLFEAHDKSRFEAIALSFGPDDGSDLRRRTKSAFEDFVDVRKSEADLAALIGRREIDILVDLMGFTFASRFGVLARRAAPIQVNFLGYPGTMGARWMDYIIADPTTIPKEHFQFYGERVVWLPYSYQANDDKSRIAERVLTRAECGLPESAFVFCCFNNTYKINPQIFDVWMRLLAGKANSVLWLLGTSPIAERNLRREAERRGISADRLIFAPRISVADLFLDTFPYTAHTTASDALWAGLPLVTCLGETFAARVAASLLRAVGLPELITNSFREYEALALRLAHEPTLLATIKSKLAQNRKTYPLFDTARYTRHIESAYETMWRTYQDGRAPAAFAVESVGERG